MTARRGCHETPAPSRRLAVRGARPLGPIDLAADQRAGLEDALMPECRLSVRFLGAQPVRRLGRAWIVLIDVILCAHVIATPIVFSEPRIRPPDPLSASWVNRVSKSDSSLGASTSYSSSKMARSSPSVRVSWIRFQTRAPMFEDTCCFETTTLVEFDRNTLPSLQVATETSIGSPGRSIICHTDDGIRR